MRMINICTIDDSSVILEKIYACKIYLFTYLQILNTISKVFIELGNAYMGNN